MLIKEVHLKVFKKKNILSIAISLMTFLLVTVFTISSSLSYANVDAVSNSASISPIESASTDQLSIDKKLLGEKGFSAKDISLLEDDVRQVANIIREEKLDTKGIENLKQGFIKYRPEAPEKSNPKKYKIKNGSVEYDNGIKVAVPNLFNTNDKSATALATSSTGAHAITYTKSSYKFYEQTGYAQLPTVSVKDSNSRPYMMLA